MQQGADKDNIFQEKKTFSDKNALLNIGLCKVLIKYFRCNWQNFELWRGVRSDAQLSCTDTRYQKCSQSGKNGA